jgi:hypothetical protein
VAIGNTDGDKLWRKRHASDGQSDRARCVSRNVALNAIAFRLQFLAQVVKLIEPASSVARRALSMSAMGQKRTFLRVHIMSALRP